MLQISVLQPIVKDNYLPELGYIEVDILGPHMETEHYIKKIIPSFQNYREDIESNLLYVGQLGGKVLYYSNWHPSLKFKNCFLFP